MSLLGHHAIYLYQKDIEQLIYLDDPESVRHFAVDE